MLTNDIGHLDAVKDSVYPALTERASIADNPFLATAMLRTLSP
jgi:hypothetical protein